MRQIILIMICYLVVSLWFCFTGKLGKKYHHHEPISQSQSLCHEWIHILWPASLWLSWWVSSLSYDKYLPCLLLVSFSFSSCFLLRHLLEREREMERKRWIWEERTREFKGQIKSRSSENISGREETQWRIIAMKRKYKDYTWERMTESTSKTWREMKGEEERILIQRQREEEKKGHEALKGQIKKKNVSFQWDYIRKNGNAMKKKYRDYIWQRMTDSSRKRREQHNDKLWKIESCFQHIHQPFLFSCLMSYEGWSLKRLKKPWVSRQINTWRISVKEEEEEESSWGDWNRPTQKDSEKERSERAFLATREKFGLMFFFLVSLLLPQQKEKGSRSGFHKRRRHSKHVFESWNMSLNILLLRDSLCFRCLLTFLSLFSSWEEHLHHVCLHRLFFFDEEEKRVNLEENSVFLWRLLYPSVQFFFVLLCPLLLLQQLLLYLFSRDPWQEKEKQEQTRGMRPSIYIPSGKEKRKGFRRWRSARNFSLFIQDKK